MINKKKLQQKIVEYHTYSKEFSFWKIDTNIYNILNVFFNKAKTYALELQEKKIILIKKNSFDYFAIIIKSEINEYILTPSSFLDQKDYVVKGTMIQYLKVLLSFSLIKPLGAKVYNDSDLLSGLYLVNEKIFISKNFSNLFNRLFLNLLENSKEGTFWARKFVYSIFVSYCSTFLGDDDEFNKILFPKKKESTFFAKESIDKSSHKCGYFEFIDFIRNLSYDPEESIEKYMDLSFPRKK